MRLREALVARYFPEARARVERLFRDAVGADRVAESPPDDETQIRERTGRSRGFRNKVLEIYDYQCAACGLRINIPGVADGTFVDAAHLIPFEESCNDHPTNGMALCKNHHWAMDRFLIAPSAEGKWRASPRLMPHRSRGEADLAQLKDREVLQRAPRWIGAVSDCSGEKACFRSEPGKRDSGHP
jgi:putative restriction endonuclease